jgi:alpha-N-arabinofuranosidase
MDGKKIPALTSSVSEDKNGNIHCTITNLNPDKELSVSVELVGKSFEKVNSASVLTAPEYNSYNSFDKPEVVKPIDFKNYKKINASTLQVTIPSKAVLVLEMK